MKTRSKRILAAGLLTSAALALTACSRSSVPVAVILPLTGQYATYGVAIEKGIKLAYEELKEEKHLAVKIDGFKVRDTKSELDRVVLWTEKEIDGGAVAIIGGVTTAEAKAMIPIADKKGVLLLSPSASSPELSGISKNFFRVWPSDQTEATKLAQSAYGELGAKTLVVVAGEDPYSKGAEKVFKAAYTAAGGQILETIEYPASSRDLSGVAVRVSELQPQGVFVADYADGAARFIGDLRKRQFPGRVLTTSAFATSASVERLGADAQGVILAQTAFDLNSTDEDVKTFVASFKTAYGEVPDIYAAYGYDAMRALSHAAQGRQITSADLIAGLRSDAFKSYEGITGPISFDDKGDVMKTPRLYTIGSDLKPVPLDPSTLAPVPPPVPPAAPADDSTGG
jgi:branched-chain amino acid transport system substrate-binding protein